MIRPKRPLKMLAHRPGKPKRSEQIVGRVPREVWRPSLWPEEPHAHAGDGSLMEDWRKNAHAAPAFAAVAVAALVIVLSRMIRS